MQEQDRPDFESSQRPRSGIDEDLARRLDSLSRVDAERVLERAIQIQAQKHSGENFTAEQVRRIAGELGVDRSVVDRALREEMAQAPAAAKEGWLVPERMSERAVVPGTQSEVSERIRSWMETEEGLRPVTRLPDGGLRWEPDRHWTTSTRLAMGSDGTKALRGMPSVEHRQTTLSPDEQLVELDVATGRIKATAWGVGAGLAAVGLGGGIATAAAIPGSDLIQFVSVAAPMAAVAVGTTVTIAKGWASAIRKGMVRALEGISHPELHERAQRRRQRRQRRDDRRRPRSRIERLVDEVSDVLDDLFD